MAIYTLFDNDSEPGAAEPMVPLTPDVGRMPRERRLALYVGACRELGLAPEACTLRFIRCNDGTLRLSVPAPDAVALRERIAATTPLAFLRGGRPSAGELALLRGGVDRAPATGIAYTIDLGSGHLSVAAIVHGDPQHANASSADRRPSRRAAPRRERPLRTARVDTSSASSDERLPLSSVG